MVIPSPVKGYNNDVVSQNENETSPSQVRSYGYSKGNISSIIKGFIYTI